MNSSYHCSDIYIVHVYDFVLYTEGNYILYNRFFSLYYSLYFLVMMDISYTVTVISEKVYIRYPILDTKY